MLGNVLSKVGDFVKSQLGIGDTEASGAGEGDVPWGDEKETGFFDQYKIEANRWNKLYPYRLLVYDVKRKSIYLGKKKKVTSFVTKKNVELNPATGIEYLSYSQKVHTGGWECILPITPQQLSIVDQFAISTTATMRGVVEEHNGVKFKTISASGTTGIWAKKPTLAGEITKPTILGSILGGTLTQLGGLVNSVKQLSSTIMGKQNPNEPKKADTPAKHESTEKSTGYYQAMYLSQFFERYAQLKKNPNNKHLRLVFDMPKQNQAFVVTPMSFSLNQSQQKPNEIMFSFQLKAWKRINLNDLEPAANNLPLIDTNILQRINATINEARKVMAKSKNLIKAVRGDTQKVFDTLRQTTLLIKDIGGFPRTVGDTQKDIIQDSRIETEKRMADLKSVGIGWQRDNFGFIGYIYSLEQDAAFKNGTGKPNKETIIQVLNKKYGKREGLYSNSTDDQLLEETLLNQDDLDIINDVFENPEEYFELFDELLQSDVNYTSEQLDAIDEEAETIALTTVEDLRVFREEIANLALQISNNYGAGNSTFSTLYGLPAPRTRTTEMSIEENEILAILYEVIQAYDILTASKQIDDLNVLSPLEYVGGLANESGINFDQSQSKILVPVPHGLSIEEVAARYFGDPDKWIEIATINALKSPYIDEDGYFIEFNSNGEGRQFIVEDMDNRLYLNQKINLSSNSIPYFSRKIIALEELNDFKYLVTVDGEANLDSLTTLQGAKMQAYLPGTVNSQNLIYIPVDAPSQVDDRIFEIPYLKDQNLTKLSKVDFLLTDNNDLAVNSFGDFRLANGLTNLVQALKLKVQTQKGSLLRHLDFGLGIKHGISVADIESGELVNAFNEIIVADERFSGLDRIQIRLEGSALIINLSVSLANDTGIVPISFNVNI